VLVLHSNGGAGSEFLAPSYNLLSLRSGLRACAFHDHFSGRVEYSVVDQISVCVCVSMR